MKSLDSETRRSKIRDAVSKVLSADVGAFCNISEKSMGKIMITVENYGEEGSVTITIQGDLTDDMIGKIQPIVESYGGDVFQMQASLDLEKSVEFIDKVLTEATGNQDVDIEVELALE